MRNLTPSTPSKYPHRRKLYTPGTKVSDMDPCRDRYSREIICVLVTLSTPFLAPNEGTEKSRAKGTVLCVRGFVFLGVCCLFQIGAGLSSVSMPPRVIACKGVHQPSSNAFGTFWTPLWISPARQCRPACGRGPGCAQCRLRVERCVCVVLYYFECATCIRLVQGCTVSAWHLW